MIDQDVGRTPGEPTSGDDDYLFDFSHEIMFKAIEMAESVDQAARAMLLAVAALTHDSPTFGRAIPTSSMLLAATGTALETYFSSASPPPEPAAEA